MAVFSLAAFAAGGRRIRGVLAAAIAIAAVSPFAANWDWTAVPDVVRQYLQAGYGRGHFPFFPCASYLGFGMTRVRATVYRDGAHGPPYAMGRADRRRLILAAQYVSNLPYSVYPKSNFWTDNPALIVMCTGISLVILAGCYTWTAYCAGPDGERRIPRSRAQFAAGLLGASDSGLRSADGCLSQGSPAPATITATLATIALMVGDDALCSGGSGDEHSPQGRWDAE